MQTYTIAPADLEKYFDGFARRIAHRPGAAHLCHPAKTAKAIPESILAHLTAKLSRRARPRRRLDAGMSRANSQGDGPARDQRSRGGSHIMTDAVGSARTSAERKRAQRERKKQGFIH